MSEWESLKRGDLIKEYIFDLRISILSATKSKVHEDIQLDRKYELEIGYFRTSIE